MKVQTHYRSFDLDSRKLDKSNRSIFLSFSSENPVERMYSGEILNEVLDHHPSSVNLDRLKAEGSVLRNHDPDQLVGKVEQVEIAGRKGRAKVRFGRSDKANETWSLIEDGILTGVSMCYEVHESVRENNTLRVTKWMPTEISMVTNAADLSVGIGRSKSTENKLLIREKIMTTKIQEENKRGKTAYDRGITEGKQEAIAVERDRVRQITALCKDFACEDIAERALTQGLSVDVVQEAILQRRQAKDLAGQETIENWNRAYSSSNIEMLNGNNPNNDTVSRELDQFIRSKGEARGLSINTGTGGNAVIPFRNSSLENLLRENSPIRDLVDVIPIDGNDSFEEVISSGMPGSTWIGETDARTEGSNAVLNKVTTALKEIYSLQTLTQRLLDQSYVDLSSWLMQRMTVSIAELESDGFVNGTGIDNEPAGLLSYTMATTDDSTRAFGTLQYTASGNATALDDADKLIELFYALKAGHRSRSTWLMNSNTARTVMQLKDGIGNYLWSHGDVASDRPATLLSRPVVILEDLPDIGADTFPVWVGDWRSAIRFINSGIADVTPDPYSNRPNVDFYSYFYVGYSVRDTEAVKALKIEA